jgi:hypothetical protein
MSVSVLRLPMVYGLDGEGNLARMIDAVARGRFPPWPKINNRRWNLFGNGWLRVFDALDVRTDSGCAGPTAASLGASALVAARSRKAGQCG